MPNSVTDKVYIYDDLHRFARLSIRDVSALTKKIHYTLLPPIAHTVYYFHLPTRTVKRSVVGCLLKAKVKVKVALHKSQRHIGGVKVWLHSFLTSKLDAGEGST